MTTPRVSIVKRSNTSQRRQVPRGIYIFGTLAGALIMIGLLGPLVAGDPNAQDLSARLQSPLSGGHLLGTDGQGRDILARILAGARPSMISALLPVAVACAVGAALGISSSLAPRWMHSLVMRTLDVFYAFPAVLLAIAIAAALGPGTTTTVISLAVVLIPPVARIAEAETMRLVGMDFMEAAQASGAGRFRIATWQVFPNVLPALLVYGTGLIGIALVFAGGMSFLGLGVTPPNPEWGSMINEQRQYMYTAPASALVPAVVIFGASLIFNQLGDALRDLLDIRRNAR